MMCSTTDDRRLQHLALRVGHGPPGHGRADHVVEVAVDGAVHVRVDHVARLQRPPRVPRRHPLPLEVVDVRAGRDGDVEREGALRDAARSARRPRSRPRSRPARRPPRTPRPSRSRRASTRARARSRLADLYRRRSSIRSSAQLERRSGSSSRMRSTAMCSRLSRPIRPTCASAEPARAQRLGQARPQIQRDPDVVDRDEVLAPVGDLDDERAVLADRHHDARRGRGPTTGRAGPGSAGRPSSGW